MPGPRQHLFPRKRRNRNKSKELVFAFSFQLKDALLDKMENMEVASMQQATLVVGVIAMATDNEDGISDDSQVFQENTN